MNFLHEYYCLCSVVVHRLMEIQEVVFILSTNLAKVKAFNSTNIQSLEGISSTDLCISDANKYHWVRERKQKIKCNTRNLFSQAVETCILGPTYKGQKDAKPFWKLNDCCQWFWCKDMSSCNRVSVLSELIYKQATVYLVDNHLLWSCASIKDTFGNGGTSAQVKALVLKSMI